MLVTYVAISWRTDTGKQDNADSVAAPVLKLPLSLVMLAGGFAGVIGGAWLLVQGGGCCGQAPWVFHKP